MFETNWIKLPEITDQNVNIENMQKTFVKQIKLFCFHMGLFTSTNTETNNHNKTKKSKSHWKMGW